MRHISRVLGVCKRVLTSFFGNVKGNWFCVVAAAITFLTIPHTEFVSEMGTDVATFTFRFPNFSYMLVGIIVSVLGIVIGTILNRKNDCS